MVQCPLNIDVTPTDNEFRLGYAFETGDGVDQNLRQAEIHYLNSGSPVSNYRLGCILESGGLGKPDAKGAFRRMRKAADAGYVPARVRLAEYYAGGFGVDRDPISAMKIYIDLYHESADDSSGQQALDCMKALLERFDVGSPTREYLTGLACEGILIDPTFREALSHYENAGAKGVPEAWFRAGALHETKSAPDMKSAIRCYKSAFEGGSIQSSMRLGILCFEGKGLDQDIPLSFKFFRRAAEGGDPYGNLWSAIMLQYGIGSGKDGRAAKQYYEYAVKAGIPDALLWEGLLLRYGTDDVPRNVLDAYGLFKKASDFGNGRAMYELGRMYENGVGVKADNALARKHYGMADRNGCTIVNGVAEPVDPQSYLGDAIRSKSSIYLPILCSPESCSEPYEENVPTEPEKVEFDEPESEPPETKEEPHEVLERLNDSMNKGGVEAQNARDEALFLFNSCFGLDSDFDRMYKLYILALSDHDLKDLQFRIAQMKSDADSPIYDENDALKWYEKAFNSGKKESAICIGDYYLDRIPSVSQNLRAAALWYMKAIRKRSEFTTLESRFSRIRNNLRGSSDAESIVTIARMLVESKHAGHDTILRFYTDALKLKRIDVAVELRDYIQSHGLRYDNESLLNHSLNLLKQSECSRAGIVYEPLKQPDGTTNSSDSAHTSGKLSNFAGHKVSKLFPQLTYQYNLDRIVGYDRRIDRIIENPKKGIKSISELFSNPAEVIEVYNRSYNSEPERLYVLASKLYLLNQYIGTRLMCIAAVSGNTPALRYCSEKLNVHDVDDVGLAVDILRKSASAGDPEAMYKLALLYDRYPAYGDSNHVDQLLCRASKRKHQAASMMLAARQSQVENERKSTMAPEAPYREAAERGEMWAILKMGEMLLCSDVDEAVVWYTKAADLGDSKAMCKLGVIYKENVRLKDEDKSLDYLMKASKLGNGEALYVLGTIYEDIDKKLAKKLFKASLNAGYWKATGKLYRKDVDKYGLKYSFDSSCDFRFGGVLPGLGDDSGRFMDNSWEK